MLSIHAISEEVHPFELGFIRFSDGGKTSEAVSQRQMYMLYIGAIGCFDRILHAVRHRRSGYYTFEGGSQFNCRIVDKNTFHVEYMGFSGTYDRAELFKSCHSFLAQSIQQLSSAGYGEHAVALDLSEMAESFQ